MKEDDEARATQLSANEKPVIIAFFITFEKT
jgi:hypothetical protein